jgi:hypothetical protein
MDGSEHCPINGHSNTATTATGVDIRRRAKEPLKAIVESREAAVVTKQ